jgi:PAS domain S-box-containing protein
MSTATNTLLLTLDLVILSSVVLWLHRISPRYGLAPLITGLAAIVTVLHTLGPVGVYVRAVPGLELVVGSTVLVPVALLGILLIYAVQGTAAARVTIFGILGVSGLALGLHLIQAEHLTMPGGGNVAGLPAESPAFARSAAITTGSLVAFALSLSVIVIVYQAIQNLLPRTPAWLTPGLALMAAMWCDTLVFRALAFGWTGSVSDVPGALAAKTVSTLVVWPLAGWYMARVAPNMPGYEEAKDRGALDLLFGTYGRQAQALTLTEAARRLTEDELKEAQARLATIVSNAPIIFFALNADGIFTLSEGKGLETLGLEPGQLVGHSALDLYPEARDQIRRALSGESFTATMTGGEFVWETTYTPMIGPDGATLGAIGVATDVTERARALRALRDSERRFRSTFEQAAVGIAHVDLNGGFLRVNPRLADILGYTQEELLELDFQSVTHPGDRADNVGWMARAAEGSLDSFTLEKRYLHKGGAIIWANVTVALLRDDRGEPAYFVSVVEDITDRRATEEQLRQAQKMEVVGQLTGGVAHDFNNLMTVIMGGLELARDDVRDRPNVAAAIESALDATRKGASLTQRLLAFSRKQTLRPTTVDAASMLSGMQELLTRSLGEEVEISWTVERDLWGFVADRHQMENAILNLAVNARDALPNGGALTIRASNVRLAETSPSKGTDPGDYVLLEVDDDGIGMPEAIVDRAFEPFFTTKEVGKGSGLGLSMVYGFVRQSGGHVRISSAQGEGTTVQLYMPRGSGEPDPAPRTSADGDPLGNGELILVVEDDRDVRRLVVKILGRLGYGSVEAADGEGALVLLDRRPDIDLLFTDIVLPGGTTGADLAREAQRRRPGMPVVYTSGYSRDALSHDGRLDAGVDLVEKPFEKAELAKVLNEALRR